MKNEVIVLIVAFVGILYLMFHHNQAVAGTPTNASPQATLPGVGLGGGLGRGSTYAPPTPIQLTTPSAPPTSTFGQPTCTGGSCGGSPTLGPSPISQIKYPTYPSGNRITFSTY